MTRRLSLLLFLSSTLSLAAAPLEIGFERGVSTPSYGPAYMGGTPALPAFHEGDGYVAWKASNAYRNVILGSPILPDGTLVNPEGSLISLGTGEWYALGSVLWLRDSWVVFWKEPKGVYARKIGRDGTFLSAPILLYDVGERWLTSSWGFRAASNGETVLLTLEAENLILLTHADLTETRKLDFEHALRAPSAAATDGRDYVLVASPPIYANGPRMVAKISGAGEVVKTLRIPFDDAWTVAPPVWNGSEYRIFVAPGRMVRIAPDLTVLASVRDLPGYGTPLVRDGVTLLLSWTSNEGTGEWTLRSFAIDEQGIPATEAVPHFTQDAVAPAVEFVDTGSGYLAVGPGLRALFVSEDLSSVRNVIPNQQTRGPGAQWDLRVSGDLAIFHEANEPGGNRLMAGRAGQPASEIARARFLGWPAIASTGAIALAAWFDRDDDGRTHLRGRLFSNDGHSITPQFTIAEDASPWILQPYRFWDGFGLAYDARPAIAWTGTHFLVAWSYRYEIVMARVSSTGNVIDRQPRKVVAPTRLGQIRPAMARLPDSVLLVWTEGTQTQPCAIVCGDLPSRIRAARLTLHGEVIDTQGFDIANDDYSTSPEIATNGDTALIVWQRGLTAFARRFRSSGSLPDLTPFSVGGAYGWYPVVAAHEDGFVVTGSERRWNWPGWSIGATPVSKSGVVGETTVVAGPDRGAQFPYIWTRENGRAAIAYEVTAPDTKMSARLLYLLFDSGIPARGRSVRP